MTRFNDETIIQFLDGELPEAEASAIAERLAENPELMARAEALSPDLETVKRLMDDLLAGAPTLDIPMPQERRPIWQYAAAAAVIFCIGLAGGTQLSRLQGSAAWHQAVADYQVLYATETLTMSPLEESAKTLGLERTAAMLGKPLPIEALQVEGLRFMRAQILKIDGAPLAQLVFLDPTGNPVAFCITRREGTDTESEGSRITGLNARSWRHQGYGFILIGNVEPAKLETYEQKLRVGLGV